MYGGPATDIFQGDIFKNLELEKPMTDGHREFPLAHAMVVSHDCEFGKAEKWGTGYRLLVAPLRDVEAFETGHGEPGTIRKNIVRFLFYLPKAAPLGDEYAADFTAIQPVTVAELLEADFWTSIGPGLKPALQGALTVFFTDRRPLRKSSS